MGKLGGLGIQIKRSNACKTHTVDASSVDVLSIDTSLGTVTESAFDWPKGYVILDC